MNMPSTSRPHRPNSSELDYFQDRAEGLATAYGDSMPGVAEGVRAVYPEIGDAENLSVEAAQTVLAREHGFGTWDGLAQRLAAIRQGEVEEPFIAAFEAIKSGDMATLQEALASDPGIADAPSTNGNNLLGLACSFRHHDMVRLLLHSGADVNSGNRYGWTSLHQAGYSNNCELAEILLAAGARTDLYGRGDGGTPLVMALFWGHRDAADLLKAHGLVPHNLRVAAGAGAVAMVESFFNPDESLKPEAGAARGFYRPHGGFPHWTPQHEPQEILDEAFVYCIT